jgi:hypothetical protein
VRLRDLAEGMKLNLRKTSTFMVAVSKINCILTSVPVKDIGSA